MIPRPSTSRALNRAIQAAIRVDDAIEVAAIAPTGGAAPAGISPDKTLQKRTKPDAFGGNEKTNPMMPAKSQIASAHPASTPSRGISADKTLQNRTKPDAFHGNEKTNPPPQRRGRGRPRSLGLTPRQLSAAALISRGYRMSVVARSLNMSRQSLWEWRQDPRFRWTLAQLQTEAMRICLPAGNRRSEPETLRRLLELCEQAGRASADDAV